jgi:hypothetical protein
MIYFVVVAVLVAATALLFRFLFTKNSTSNEGGVPREDSNNSLAFASGRMSELLPSTWDDQHITQRILALEHRPPVLAHFINSLKGRFIIGQNDKTAQKRTQLILSVTKQLHATKELRIALDDLQLHELERDIRFKKTELERRSIEDRLAKQQELEDLHRRKERLELEVQIAKLEQEKRGFNEPQSNGDKRKPTRDELREAKRSDIRRTESERDEATLEVTKGVPIDQLSEDDRDRVMRIENFYNDKRVRLEEELAKL